MRIVHTSDWHAGRVWKGHDRLPELEEILEHLGDFIEREKVELVLMTGDVFESASPPPEAERAVTRFFKRIGRGEVPSVVIAGNHDSPARLEAWGLLAELVNVHVLGLPRKAADGGLIEIPIGGQLARVAAVPFAPMGRLVETLTLAHDETRARQQYATLMQQIFASLTTSFGSDAVNLLMAHCDVAGAIHSGSERAATLGDDWAATPQAIPSRAQYVALGHIHRPQRIDAAPSPTEYAGSPMQLDFGEIGESKTFVVIDAEPGLPARISRVAYEGSKQLGEFVGTWLELESRADELRQFGYLRVQIALDAPDPDLNRRVRKLLPNVVSVDRTEPEPESPQTADRPLATAPPREHFGAFYRREHQREPLTDTLALFDELYFAASAEE
jgi:DNA repair protein SbcD/Mre11